MDSSDLPYIPLILLYKLQKYVTKFKIYNVIEDDLYYYLFEIQIIVPIEVKTLSIIPKYCM